MPTVAESLTIQVNVAGIDRATAAVRRLRMELDQVGRGGGRGGGGGGAGGGRGGGGDFNLGEFARDLFITGSAVEGFRRSIGAFGREELALAGFDRQLGGLEKARDLYRDIEGFAKRSPFNTEEAVQSARFLLPNFGQQRTLDLMTATAEAVAATGGTTEDYVGILRQLNQVQAKGRVLQEELTIISERGVPAQKLLAQELGMTEEQMGKIGDQGIKAERAISGLIRAFNREYGGSLGRAAKTQAGEFSALGDEINRLERNLGRGLAPTVKFVTRLLNDFLENYNKLPEPAQTAIGVGALGAWGLTGAAGVAGQLGLGALGFSTLFGRGGIGGGRGGAGAAGGAGRFAGFGRAAKAAGRFGFATLPFLLGELGLEAAMPNPRGEDAALKQVLQWTLGGAGIGAGIGLAAGKSPAAFLGGAALGGTLGFVGGELSTQGWQLGGPKAAMARQRFMASATARARASEEQAAAGGQMFGTAGANPQLDRIASLLEEQNRLLGGKGGNTQNGDVPGRILGILSRNL